MQGMSGTSIATPVVAGAAALLLSVQRAMHGRIDPLAVRDAIVATARPCPSAQVEGGSGCLAGILDVAAAYRHLLGQHDLEPHALTRTTPVGVRAAGLEPAHEAASPAGTPSDIAAEGRTESGEPEQGGAMTVPNESADSREIASAPTDTPAMASSPGVQAAAEEAVPEPGPPSGVTPACADERTRAVKPAGGCGCGGLKASADEPAPAAAAAATAVAVAAATPSYVYGLGTVGFDFGTEARRDTFRQLMPDVPREVDGKPVSVSPNPYDVFQLSDYLNGRPSESTKLIWTLNLDLTPIYALEAEVAYPEDVYSTLRDALARQAIPEDDVEHVSRVSIPGVLTNRTVRLFSGQLLPVVVVQPRGLFEWNIPVLIDQVIDAVRGRPENIGNANFDENRVRRLVKIFLDKVYFECRNLGAAPPDRALNFAATNAFQVAARDLPGAGLRRDHAERRQLALQPGLHRGPQEPVLPDGLRLLGRADHVVRPGERPPREVDLPVHDRRQRRAPGEPRPGTPVPRHVVAGSKATAHSNPPRRR